MKQQQSSLSVETSYMTCFCLNSQGSAASRAQLVPACFHYILLVSKDLKTCSLLYLSQQICVLCYNMCSNWADVHCCKVTTIALLSRLYTPPLTGYWTLFVFLVPRFRTRITETSTGPSKTGLGNDLAWSATLGFRSCWTGRQGGAGHEPPNDFSSVQFILYSAVLIN